MGIARGSVWKHLKTGHLYIVLRGGVINATNAQDGQRVVLYQRVGGFETPLFVREDSEFKTKFELFK